MIEAHKQLMTYVRLGQSDLALRFGAAATRLAASFAIPVQFGVVFPSDRTGAA
jgi:hypothetical protein